MPKKLIFLILSILFIAPALATAGVIEKTNDTYFSFAELRSLSEDILLSKDLQSKLQKILNTAVNSKYPIAEHSLQFNPQLKKNFFRVTHWNIERGFNLKVINRIINESDQYLSKNVDFNSFPKNSDQYKNLVDEVEHLKNTDIFILNEVDIGMPRTDYRNIAEDMAQIIGGAYAFAPEFIEVDDSVLKDPKLNKEKFLGLHGNAIVSRFPIPYTRIVRLPECYDWFNGERENLTLLESTKRTAAKATVDEEIITEVRRGSRVALIATIQLPNNEYVTVVSAHLENRTIPSCRERQMNFILSAVRNIRTPVILGADLNSFESDASPTSVTKVVKSKASDVTFIGRTALSFVNPYSLVTNASAMGLGFVRKYKDPTVTSVPILSPNKAYGLFNMIEEFRFYDHSYFDPSDDEKYLFGKEGLWASSNERTSKGFKETFEFNRSFRIGRYKIDWLFVKPLIKATSINGQTIEQKKYFPAFGRTLLDLNNSHLKHENISDHNPISVDVIF